jgi:hypothetical protein
MDIFSKFEWHSSCPIDNELRVTRRVVRKLANTPVNRRSFYAAGENFLIHKSKRALWKVSEDGASIEPVFATDVLEESELEGGKS